VRLSLNAGIKPASVSQAVREVVIAAAARLDARELLDVLHGVLSPQDSLEVLSSYSRERTRRLRAADADDDSRMTMCEWKLAQALQRLLASGQGDAAGAIGASTLIGGIDVVDESPLEGLGVMNVLRRYLRATDVLALLKNTDEGG
jgi:hypothetical protein